MCIVLFNLHIFHFFNYFFTCVGASEVFMRASKLELMYSLVSSGWAFRDKSGKQMENIHIITLTKDIYVHLI